MTHPHQYLRQPALFLPIVLLLFVFLTWPVWQWLWREWMGNDYYSHGLLIPFVVLFLAIQRVRLAKGIATADPPNTTEQSTDTSKISTTGDTAVDGEVTQIENRSHSSFALLWFSISLVGYLYFLQSRAYYLAAFALIGLVAGLIWLLGGNRLIRQLRFPVAYLLLMVPLPFVEHITYPMAIFAGLCGGEVVQFFGMDITIVGNAVTLPNAELVIGAQCSGINSLIALSALMILAAYLLDGPMWGKLTLIVLAIPLAILGNILRIISLLYVARLYDAEAAFIFYHDYSGILFFICILLLMVPLTRFLQLNKLRMDVI